MSTTIPIIPPLIEGCSDCTVVVDLQNLIIKVASGDSYTNEDDFFYQDIRSKLLKRDDLRDIVPVFIRQCRDLYAVFDELNSSLMSLSLIDVEGRIKIRKAFAPLFDRIEQIPASHAIVVDAGKLNISSGSPEISVRPNSDAVQSNVYSDTSSAGWTGIASSKERALIIRQLAPAALEAIDNLISEQEKRLHNQPPEALPDKGLEALKEFHSELGELLKLVEASQSFEAQLSLVQSLFSGAYRWIKETGELCVMGVRPLAASVSHALIVIKAVEFMTGQAASFDGAATIAAGTTGGMIALEAVRQGKKVSK